MRRDILVTSDVTGCVPLLTFVSRVTLQAIAD
jgi:hypothetical protein